MLEYTYDEALELLTSKQTVAKKDYKEVSVILSSLFQHLYFLSHSLLTTDARQLVF
jgi:hypothetical protein